jgi:hypothetical protein
MRRLDTGIFREVILQAGLATGLLLATVGCAREDASSAQEVMPTAPQARAQLPAAAALEMPTTPSAQATRPADPDREQFRQALTRKFDATRVTRHQASPDGPILYAPNGRVAHAVVAVRNPDGTLGRHCISSVAELTALTNPSGAGAEQ